MTREYGFVYILSNACMPGLIKIGKTDNMERRLKQLYTSGVPAQFVVEYSRFTADYDKVEANAHRHFSSKRAAGREFFAVRPEEAQTFIDHLANLIDIERFGSSKAQGLEPAPPPDIASSSRCEHRPPEQEFANTGTNGRCMSCGLTIVDESKPTFCPNCGTAIRWVISGRG